MDRPQRRARGDEPGLGAGRALLAAWSRVGDLAFFYLVWAGLGVALAATLYEPVFAVLTRLPAALPHAHHRVARSSAASPAPCSFRSTQLAIAALGWRDALLVLALCNLVVALPVACAAAARPRCGESRAARARVAFDEPFRRALVHPVFWALVATITAYYATFAAITFHIIPLLAERNVPTATIIAAVAMFGPAQVAGRIALLALGAGARAPRVAGRIAFAIFPVAVALLLLFPASLAALFAFSLVYGAANGVVTVVRGTAVPELLWREKLRRDQRRAAPCRRTWRARAAPYGAALIWRAAGNYNAVLMTGDRGRARRGGVLLVRLRARRAGGGVSKLGIALGSGGARGWAHIGVLRALDEAKIRARHRLRHLDRRGDRRALPDRRARRFRAIPRRLNRIRLSQFFDFKIGAGGMIGGNRVLKVLKPMLGTTRIEQIAARRSAASRPTSPPATRSGCARAACSTRCAHPMPFPGFFPPVAAGAGGGCSTARFVNPVPVSLARALGADRGRRGRRQCRPPGTLAASRPTSRSWARAAAPRPAASSGLISAGRKGGPSTFGVLDARAADRADAARRIRLAEDPPAFVLRPEVGRIGPLEFYRARRMHRRRRRRRSRRALPALRARWRCRGATAPARIDRHSRLRLNPRHRASRGGARCVATARPISPSCVEPDRVHRSVYSDPAIFELEMDRIFEKVWIYFGHESQVPKPGDYYDRADRPPADDDGAPRRRQDPRALQPLRPSRRHGVRQPPRQYRQGLHLLLSFLAVPHRRHARELSAAQGL